MTDDEKAEAVRLIQAYEATDPRCFMTSHDIKHPAQKAFFDFMWHRSDESLLYAGRIYLMDSDGCLCRVVLSDPEQVVNLDEDA